MSRMTALDELLADVDAHLLDSDAQTITESLERGEAPDHADADLDCPWCSHGFHGLPCAPSVEFLIATLQFVDDDDAIDDAALPLEHPLALLWPCRCDSSLDPLDDTWRPIWSGDAAVKLAHDVAWHMRKTGLDGWSARADLELRRHAREVAFREIADKVVAAAGSVVLGFTEVGDALVAAFGSASAALNRMHFEVVPTVPFHAPPVIDEVPIETAADRALRARQQRNTGPDRPTANRARRPRRHGG